MILGYSHQQIDKGGTQCSWGRNTCTESIGGEAKLNTTHRRQKTENIKQEVTKHQTETETWQDNGGSITWKHKHETQTENKNYNYKSDAKTFNNNEFNTQKMGQRSKTIKIPVSGLWGSKSYSLNFCVCRWQLIVDLAPVFEATISKEPRSRVYSTQSHYCYLCHDLKTLFFLLWLQHETQLEEETCRSTSVRKQSWQQSKNCLKKNPGISTKTWM